MSKGWLKKFAFAGRGICYVLKKEAHMRIHLTAAVIVIAIGLFFQLTQFEWIALIGCIGFVIFAEIVNTSIEKIVDLIHPEWHERAGIIKDIAAGAVLIASLISIIIGFIVFWPHLCDTLNPDV